MKLEQQNNVTKLNIFRFAVRDLNLRRSLCYHIQFFSINKTNRKLFFILNHLVVSVSVYQFSDLVIRFNDRNKYLIHVIYYELLLLYSIRLNMYGIYRKPSLFGILLEYVRKFCTIMKLLKVFSFVAYMLIQLE